MAILWSLHFLTHCINRILLCTDLRNCIKIGHTRNNRTRCFLQLPTSDVMVIVTVYKFKRKLFWIRNWYHIDVHLVLLLVGANLFKKCLSSVVLNRIEMKFDRIVLQVIKSYRPNIHQNSTMSMISRPRSRSSFSWPSTTFTSVSQPCPSQVFKKLHS